MFNNLSVVKLFWCYVLPPMRRLRSSLSSTPPQPAPRVSWLPFSVSSGTRMWHWGAGLEPDFPLLTVRVWACPHLDTPQTKLSFRCHTLPAWSHCQRFSLANLRRLPSQTGGFLHLVSSAGRHSTQTLQVSELQVLTLVFRFMESQPQEEKEQASTPHENRAWGGRRAGKNGAQGVAARSHCFTYWCFFFLITVECILSVMSTNDPSNV